MITKLIFLLVIISGLIHPLWNMLLKKSDDKIVFYLNIHLVFTFLFSFILFIYPVNKITIAGWIFVLASAVAHLIFLREIPTIPALFGIIIVMLGVYIINQKALVFSDFFRSFGHVNKK